MGDIGKNFLDEDIYYLDIEPVEKLVLIDRIIERIGRSIEEGVLKPGDFLPGERALSKYFDVNRTTIRLALKALDFLGVLEISPGCRTKISSSVADLFKNPFKFLNIMHNLTLEELFETRRIIELEIVRKAALTSSEEDIKKLRRHLDISEKNIDKKDRFIRSEFDFHRQLFMIAKNRILTAVMINLNNLLIILERYEGDFIDLKTRMRSLEQHKKIFGYIRDRDPKMAGSAMLDHLDSMYLRLSKMQGVKD